jgi:hypothetical protein
VLVDDGTVTTRARHAAAGGHDRHGHDARQGRLRGPGLLVNPGLAFGFHRGIMCVVPYDKQVEAMLYNVADFQALLDCQPELLRNITDTFLIQLSLASRKAVQRMGLHALARLDLWDASANRVSPTWEAVLRSERQKWNPKTLNPAPETLNPRPQTLDPEP